MMGKAIEVEYSVFKKSLWYTFVEKQDVSKSIILCSIKTRLIFEYRKFQILDTRAIYFGRLRLYTIIMPLDPT